MANKKTAILFAGAITVGILLAKATAYSTSTNPPTSSGGSTTAGGGNMLYTTIPPYSCMGSGNGDTQMSACGINQGFVPYPIMPSANFYTPGNSGLMMRSISSDGSVTAYTIAYAFYSTSYFVYQIVVEFPVDLRNPTTSAKALADNATALSQFAGTYTASSAAPAVNAFTQQIGEANSYIQTHGNG